MATISNNDIARAIYLSLRDNNLEVLPPSGGKTSKYANVVKFLARRRLMSRAKDILSHLEKIINKEGGVVKARVVSVKKLQEETNKSLTQFLQKRYKAREIVLEESLNENLLGGFRVEVNDEVLDLTFRNKILKLQEYLTR